MKRNTTILIILLASFLSIANAQSVQISATGFNNFKTVTLKVFDAKTLQYVPIATKNTEADKPSVFNIDFSVPNLYELNFDEKDMVPVSITGPASILVKKENGKTVIKGSPGSEKIQVFLRSNNELQAKYFGKMKENLDKAMAENDQATVDKIQQQIPAAIESFLTEFRALIVDMGTTPEAYYAMQFSDFNKELDFIESRLNVFKKEQPNSPLTDALAKQVYQARVTAIGNTPPAFTARDIAGNAISLDDYKGNVLLVDFWAFWCRACRIENPKLATLYSEYNAKGLEIVSISQDQSEDQWKKGIDKDGIGAWRHVWDKDNSISELYSVSSLPQNLLLDKDGKIVAKNLSADDLRQILGELLH